ncbi:hypothetical protein DP939_11725 [Spongiactinospora rosea]|uniref:Peptidase S1 domain-containing protein n=2 Tax=Spongiactinospora rosea TaxID=2248750 RepID=A0A366M2M2_9ACTN|nr:hypothetical protein DP939_11725 [Spongiactinospora rosea]
MIGTTALAAVLLITGETAARGDAGLERPPGDGKVAASPVQDPAATLAYWTDARLAAVTNEPPLNGQARGSAPAPPARPGRDESHTQRPRHRERPGAERPDRARPSRGGPASREESRRRPGPSRSVNLARPAAEDPRNRILTKGGDSRGYAPWPTPYSADSRSRITGKLFFFDEVDRRDESCSASVVKSQSRNVISTAAHCLINGTTWSSRVLFIPAYRESGGRVERPFGRWAATQSFIPRRYLDANAGFNVDIGLVALAPDDRGRRVQNVVGGFVPHISRTGTKFPPVINLGYPQEGPYTGGLLYRCDAHVTDLNHRDDNSLLTTRNCRVAPGNSGGPWITRWPHHHGPGPAIGPPPPVWEEEEKGWLRPLPRSAECRPEDHHHWYLIGVLNSGNGTSEAARLHPSTYGILAGPADRAALRAAGQDHRLATTNAVPCGTPASAGSDS